MNTLRKQMLDRRESLRKQQENLMNNPNANFEVSSQNVSQQSTSECNLGYFEGQDRDSESQLSSSGIPGLGDGKDAEQNKEVNVKHLNNCNVSHFIYLWLIL